MSNPVTVQERHEREIRALVPWSELKYLIAEHVCKGVNPPIRPRGFNVKVDVRLEDETEGSPGYKIGSRAIVVLTQDLTMIAPPSAAR